MRSRKPAEKLSDAMANRNQHHSMLNVSPEVYIAVTILICLPYMLLYCTTMNYMMHNRKSRYCTLLEIGLSSSIPCDFGPVLIKHTRITLKNALKGALSRNYPNESDRSEPKRQHFRLENENTYVIHVQQFNN